MLDQVRVFRNHPAVRWEYRVHEQILPAVTRSGGAARWTDIIVDHAGYQDPALRRRKLERNLQLLLLEEKERPHDPFTLFNLGRTRLDLGAPREALALFRRSLERSAPDLSIVRKLYALLARGHRLLGEAAEAEGACRAGLTRFPEDAELLFHQGVLLRERGDLAAAEACLVRLLGTRPAEYFDMVDVGVRGYKARHELALVHRAQGRLTEAEAQWRAALAERADYAPAAQALAEHLGGRRRERQVMPRT